MKLQHTETKPDNNSKKKKTWANLLGIFMIKL